MSFHPRNLTGTAVPDRDELESLIRADYETTHPGDTFDDFKSRSQFDKHDKGLMRDWLALAAERHANELHLERRIDNFPGSSFLAIRNYKAPPY